MLLAIEMPAWLQNIWTEYSGKIVPVLVTVALALLTWLACKIKSDAKLNKARAEAQLKALQDVAGREDTRPELEAQAKEISELKRVVTLMSELFNVAFQNSTLDPEVKSSISAIASRITYGDDGKVIEELKNANEKLTGEIEGLKHELEGEPVVVEEPTITRTRR